MISTLPLMIIFVLTYKTVPALSFFVYFVMGFVTMLAVPVTMNMAQSILPQYKSIIGGFIGGLFAFIGTLLKDFENGELFDSKIQLINLKIHSL